MTNVAYMQPHQDQDPDVVAYTLQCVLAMAPGFSAALAKQIEDRVKSEFGGRRLFLPKGAKRLTPEQRQEVFKDGLTTMSTSDLVEKHNISRRTIYRVMKEGGGRFGE
jgi:Mor family transcriptional regulator